jgi:hypothetical protein
VSNGDSGSDQEQQSYAEIIVTDLGTNFNVDLREIKLTGEDRKHISSEIINVILARMERSPSPADSMEPIDIEITDDAAGEADEYSDGCNDYKKFRSYKA